MFQPRSTRTSESSAVSSGIRPLRFGKPFVYSSITAIPTLLGFRPVSRAARLGEQRAVVWNCVYRRPRSAIRFRLGMATRPPYESQVPKPVSSQTTNSTLGAPAGALGATNGFQSGTELRMSSSIDP